MGVVKDRPNEDNGGQPPKDFDISGVYLLNSSGSILAHKDIGNSAEFNPDIFGAMFTAIQILLEESTGSHKQLQCINYGGFNILIEHTKDFFLVMVGTGAVTEPLKDNLKWLADRIALDFEKTVSTSNGEIPDMVPIHRIMDKFTKSFVSKSDYLCLVHTSST